MNSFTYGEDRKQLPRHSLWLHTLIYLTYAVNHEVHHGLGH